MLKDVTINFTWFVNGAPLAVDDLYSTNEDTLFTVSGSGILENDQDPDGDPLASILVTGPANGIPST